MLLFKDLNMECILCYDPFVSSIPREMNSMGHALPTLLSEDCRNLLQNRQISEEAGTHRLESSSADHRFTLQAKLRLVICLCVS